MEIHKYMMSTKMSLLGKPQNYMFMKNERFHSISNYLNISMHVKSPLQTVLKL